MIEREANTKQVFKWALSHVSTIVAAISFVVTVVVMWNTFQTQWKNHVDPNCVETPTAVPCRIDRFEKKLDRVEAKLDQLFLVIPKKSR